MILAPRSPPSNFFPFSLSRVIIGATLGSSCFKSKQIQVVFAIILKKKKEEEEKKRKIDISISLCLVIAFSLPLTRYLSISFIFSRRYMIQLKLSNKENIKKT